MSDNTENATEKQPKKRGPYKTKATGRGGARAGGGRPRGSTNKIDIKTLLTDFTDRSGMSFEAFVNNEIITAKINGDKELVAKYILGLSKYYLPEPTSRVDVTTNGETLRANFTFLPVELPEWQQK
jgi:hypothetical protein